MRRIRLGISSMFAEFCCRRALYTVWNARMDGLVFGRVSGFVEVSGEWMEREWRVNEE